MASHRRKTIIITVHGLFGVWFVVGGGWLVAHRAKATAEKVAAFLHDVDLAKLSASERAKALQDLSKQMAALPGKKNLMSTKGVILASGGFEHSQGLRDRHLQHKTQEDWQRVVATTDRLVVLLPQVWAEYRDRGLAHAELGHTASAVTDLEIYLSNVEEGLDIDAIAGRVANLRRALSG